MNIKEKKALLVRLIELSVYLGEDITDLIIHPLAYYDFDKVALVVSAKEKQYEEQ